MTISLNFPPEISKAFGNELERKSLEVLSLQLVHQKCMTIAKVDSTLNLNHLEALS